jgi:aryl-alcohol dehydrogenase-like predicted oxidoreductase
MQLAGKDGNKLVWGPPRDVHEAIAVLREAVASGVNHIDTADFYGPYITNQIIHKALSPYPDDLVLVTKVGAARGADGSWNASLSREDLAAAVHSNLKNLGREVLDVVNLRVMFSRFAPAEGSIEPLLAPLAELREQGLIRNIGLSNVTPAQVAEAWRIVPIVCVQNEYNLAHRTDDAFIDDLAREGIAYVPYFPLGGFSPLQSNALSKVASRLQCRWRSRGFFIVPPTSWSSREHLPASIFARISVRRRCCFTQRRSRSLKQYPVNPPRFQRRIDRTGFAGNQRPNKKEFSYACFRYRRHRVYRLGSRQ